MTAFVFREHAPLYRAAGFWARPVRPGSKAARVSEWQLPDSEHPPGAFETWLNNFGDHGLGLVMGSPLADGTRLGAIDIDRDDYLPLVRVLLDDPVCARVGKKGAVFFVRISHNLRNPVLRVKGLDAQSLRVGECLFDRAFCVIPPTIHPETGLAYRWLGTSLLEVDIQHLPLIEE
jgi:hypothetical protein